MLYYELKKIWVKTGTKIVMLILAITLVLSCYFAIHGVYYVNENGENEYGIEAIHKLKAAKKEWAGLLTEEVIANVIAENNRLNDTEMGRSEAVRDSNIVFGWKQGFYDIRWMLVRSFCKFRESDYYVPDSLVPDDARFFYGNRLLHLQEWLEEDTQQNLFTEAERDFLIQRYQTLEAQAPFYYDYADGWNELFEWAAMVIMLTMLVLNFVVAGIFSGEFSSKADSVFYASCHGRGRAVAAKLGAGLLFVTLVYFAMMLLYSGIVLAVFGTDGAELLIQTGNMGWKSFYLVTNLQKYLLILFGGYIGTLFILSLTMLVSARTKSSVVAVTIPFILLFLPSFIGGGSWEMVDKILGILPDRLLDINVTLSQFSLYQIGGKVMGSLHILPVLYGTLALLLIPTTYQVYRRLSAG
ncbi:MAG: ABC transporter permease [Lachnospiraceae bacterium]|nr:ABC transporter permease [Lachnospiraceae bacterium]